MLYRVYSGFIGEVVFFLQAACLTLVRGAIQSGFEGEVGLFTGHTFYVGEGAIQSGFIGEILVYL